MCCNLGGATPLSHAGADQKNLGVCCGWILGEKTQFPNCIGALDGKRIRVKKPPHSGSSYFNYKKYFSVVLLALTDAHLKFFAVDVGAYGSQGDSRMFRES